MRCVNAMHALFKVHVVTNGVQTVCVCVCIYIYIYIRNCNHVLCSRRFDTTFLTRNSAHTGNRIQSIFSDYASFNNELTILTTFMNRKRRELCR